MRILNPKNWQIEWYGKPRICLNIALENWFGAWEFDFIILGIGFWIRYSTKEAEKFMRELDKDALELLTKTDISTEHVSSTDELK
jgi:hypothetical protein